MQDPGPGAIGWLVAARHAGLPGALGLLRLRDIDQAKTDQPFPLVLERHDAQLQVGRIISRLAYRQQGAERRQAFPLSTLRISRSDREGLPFFYISIIIELWKNNR